MILTLGATCNMIEKSFGQDNSTEKEALISKIVALNL